MDHRYPLLIDVANCCVVVVGAGPVGRRKVRGLLKAGATDVTVVALAFPDHLPKGVKTLQAAYDPRQLDWAQLVFAATDSPEVNAAIVRDARARGIWASRADEAGEGDFVTPAQFNRGSAIVTVSAGSAALAVTIRDGLEKRWDERWTSMAEATRRLRAELRKRVPAPARRAEISRDLASEEALDRLATAGLTGIMAWLKERHAEFRDD